MVFTNLSFFIYFFVGSVPYQLDQIEFFKLIVDDYLVKIKFIHYFLLMLGESKTRKLGRPD